MPTYSVSKTWNASETLTAADLNGIESQVATFLNTTKLDGDNIKATATYTLGGVVLGSGGPAAPDGGNLHSFNGDASAAAHADADEGVFENSAATGISILAGASSAGNIFVGDSGDNDIGKLSYSNATNAWTIYSNATLALTLSSAQLATFAGAIQADSTLTVGLNDTGHDVKFFGATSGKSWLWDESADTEILTGNSTISGTLGVTGVLTATAQSVHTGGLVSGSNIVSDADSTDDLGTIGVRWANLYVDAIVATDTIAATSYTGALLTAVTAVTQSDDNNSTKVATTAYVDSMVGGVSGFNVGATHTWTADQTFNDSVKVTLGTGGDADLYYDGTNVVLDPRVVGSGLFQVLNKAEIRGDAADFGIMILSTAELTVVATDELGRVDFQAPLESSGSIGAAAGARIAAVAEGTFSSTDNSTSLKFMTSSTAGVAERMRIDSSGKVGIGTATPASPLSVYQSGNAYVLSHSAASSAGFKVQTANSNFTWYANTGTNALRLYDNNGGAERMLIDSSGQLTLSAGGAQVMYVDANGRIYNSSESSNANMTVGMTLQQGGHDNEILALKSSDVAHGMTSRAETDTYATFGKASSTAGGLGVIGFTEATEAIYLYGNVTTEDTSDTTASSAAIRMYASKKSGTSITDQSTTANVLRITNGTGAAMLFKENGTIHAITTTISALDEEDDIALCRAMDLAHSDGGIVHSKWDEFCAANEDDLVRIGLMGYVSPEQKAQGVKPLTNINTWLKLHNGAIGQISNMVRDISEVYESEIAELKAKMNQLLMERN